MNAQFSSQSQLKPIPTCTHVELPSWNLLPLSVFLQLSIPSQATRLQEALPRLTEHIHILLRGPRGPWLLALGRQPYSGHCCVPQLEGGLEQQDQRLLLFPAALPIHQS